jgi:hypothetical protein
MKIQNRNTSELARIREIDHSPDACRFYFSSFYFYFGAQAPK